MNTHPAGLARLRAELRRLTVDREHARAAGLRTEPLDQLIIAKERALALLERLTEDMGAGVTGPAWRTLARAGVPAAYRALRRARAKERKAIMRASGRLRARAYVCASVVRARVK